jgi:hypothetical protein
MPLKFFFCCRGVIVVKIRNYVVLHLPVHRIGDEIMYKLIR